MTNEMIAYMNKHIATMVKGMLDKAHSYMQITSSEGYGRIGSVVGVFVKGEHARDSTAAGDERIEAQALEMARKLALAALKQAIKDGRWLSINADKGEFDKCVRVTDENGCVVVSIALF